MIASWLETCGRAPPGQNKRPHRRHPLRPTPRPIRIITPSIFDGIRAKIRMASALTSGDEQDGPGVGLSTTTCANRAASRSAPADADCRACRRRAEQLRCQSMLPLDLRHHRAESQRLSNDARLDIRREPRRHSVPVTSANWSIRSRELTAQASGAQRKRPRTGINFIRGLFFSRG